jgi:hypothetical protein
MGWLVVGRCCCGGGAPGFSCADVEACLAAQLTVQGVGDFVQVSGVGIPADPVLVEVLAGMVTPGAPDPMVVTGTGTAIDPWIVSLDCALAAACIGSTTLVEAAPAPDPVTVTGTGAVGDPYVVGLDCAAVATCLPLAAQRASLLIRAATFPTGVALANITTWAVVYNDIPLASLVAGTNLRLDTLGRYRWDLRVQMDPGILGLTLGCQVLKEFPAATTVMQAEGTSGTGVTGLDRSVTLFGVLDVTGVNTLLRVLTEATIAGGTAQAAELFLEYVHA